MSFLTHSPLIQASQDQHLIDESLEIKKILLAIACNLFFFKLDEAIEESQRVKKKIKETLAGSQNPLQINLYRK